jgi:cysteine desulfuration protein SufE
VPQDFVPRIIGADLVRLRSQTVYYVLGRMKQAAQTLQTRAS